MFGILIAVVLLIVYGSLYPWQFVARDLPASPLYILLHSWDAGETSRRFIADIAVNIAMYIPLGMSGFLALRRLGSRVLEIAGPVLLGTLLSAGVEMTQLYTPTRHCSAVDLFDNALGSAVGVIAGLVFARIVDFPATLHVKRTRRDTSATALLLCWTASLLFPVFPVMWLFLWRAKLAGFVHAPLFSPVPVLLRTAEWFAAGRLLALAGFRPTLRWMSFLLLLVPAQFAILYHNPLPSDFIGAGLGVAAFAAIGRRKDADRIAFALLAAALALNGLAPFHFAARSQPFHWIPFIGLLNTEWQSGIQVLLRKLFDYGAAVWLLRRSGVRLLYATCVVAAGLAGIEAAQTHLPQHVAEINDPLLAILLGLVFRVLSRQGGMVE